MSSTTERTATGWIMEQFLHSDGSPWCGPLPDVKDYPFGTVHLCECGLLHVVDTTLVGARDTMVKRWLTVKGRRPDLVDCIRDLDRIPVEVVAEDHAGRHEGVFYAHF